MFYVIKSVRKVSDGNISCAIAAFAGIDDAKKKYHDDLSTDIGNANYSYTMEEIVDEVGGIICKETWYAPVAEEAVGE